MTNSKRRITYKNIRRIKDMNKNNPDSSEKSETEKGTQKTEKNQKTNDYEKKNTREEITKEDNLDLQNKSEKEIKEHEIKNNKTFSENIKNIINGKSTKIINILFILLLILIPVSLNIYLRVQPAFLPVTDDWAETTIYSNLQQQISQQVSKQYPLLPQQDRQKLVNQMFNNLLEEQNDQIQDQIKLLSESFKERLRNDEENITYLIAIDSYHYYRLARNEVNHGYPGDIILNESNKSESNKSNDSKLVSVDYLMHGGAPIFKKPIYYGHFSNLLDLLVSSLFNILVFIGFNVSVMQVSFFMPVILITLAVITAFFLGKRLGGNIAGFFISLIVAIHPFVLTRTVAGFSDTDPFNILFPIVIVWMFFEAARSKTVKKTIFFSILTSFMLWLYSLAWVYGSMLVILLGAIVAELIVTFFLGYVFKFKKSRRTSDSFKKEFKQGLIIAVTFIISMWFFSSFNLSNNEFNPLRMYNDILGTLGFTQIKDVATRTIWPNVYTTVAELNPGTFSDVINRNGGLFLFVLAILGLIFTFFIKKQDNTFTLKYGFVLLFWMIATSYATLKGIRFILLTAPVFSVCIGYAIAMIVNYLSKWFKDWFEINEIVVKLSLITLFLVVLLVLPNSLFSQSKAIAYAQVPSMNDGWFNALTSIRDNAEENAIITSWWDFGHWFKAIAERQVTFDGASQNSPVAHWVGRIFSTDSEEEAIGILRMLNCGSNYAYEIISKEKNNELESVGIVKEIISLPRDEAKEVLLKHFDEEKANEILNYTHCNPPESYVITSEDMVSKAGVWAHFGSWNFTKADMFFNVRRMNLSEGIKYLQENYDLSQLDAQKTYLEITSSESADDWVSPWPGYLSKEIDCNNENSTLSCLFMVSNTEGLRILIDLNEMEAYVNEKNSTNRPNALIYINDDDVLVKKDYTTEYSPVGFSVILKESNNNYQIVLSQPALDSSIFTRLFFLNGEGTKYFEFFDQETDLFGNRIYTWKINWDKYLEDHK